MATCPKGVTVGKETVSKRFLPVATGKVRRFWGAIPEKERPEDRKGRVAGKKKEVTNLADGLRRSGQTRNHTGKLHPPGTVLQR